MSYAGQWMSNVRLNGCPGTSSDGTLGDVGSAGSSGHHRGGATGPNGTDGDQGNNGATGATGATGSPFNFDYLDAFGDSTAVTFTSSSPNQALISAGVNISDGITFAFDGVTWNAHLATITSSGVYYVYGKTTFILKSTSASPNNLMYISINVGTPPSALPTILSRQTIVQSTPQGDIYATVTCARLFNFTAGSQILLRVDENNVDFANAQYGDTQLSVFKVT